jgi:hypothetical protein
MAPYLISLVSSKVSKRKTYSDKRYSQYSRREVGSPFLQEQ